MADDETRDDTSQISDSHSGEEDSDAESVELLVAGRERRKTAGNRYDRDLVLEEVADEDDQDEVTLLFAGDEEDEDDEFKSDNPDEDAEMSSDDDDDQGPNAAADDMEGEKEIQKQAKAERAKKRKADLALTTVAGLRKKPKIDPTQMQGRLEPKKPSKKKERVTWLPDQHAAKGRTSLRKQTIEHRAITIARLKESEAQSKKLKALKEKRDREKAKDAPKELTQADRLAEAARVERRNAKSLNRWEAMEKKRAEEQAAKLAALKNRTLEGPVITLWSAKAKWIGPRLNKLGSKDTTGVIEGGTEVKKRGRKTKAYHEQMAAAREAGEAGPSAQSQGTTQPPLAGAGNEKIDEVRDEQKDKTAQPQITFTAPQGPESFLQGIHEYANMQPDTTGRATNSGSPAPTTETTTTQQQTQQNVEPTSSTQPETLESVPLPQNQTPSIPPTPVETEERPASLEQPGAGASQIDQQPSAPDEVAGSTAEQTAEQFAEQVAEQAITPLPDDAAPQPPLVEEYSTRNLVVLEKFDELSSAGRQEYGLFYNNRRTARPMRHNNELCPITTLPARYRDASTGIGFANLFAYKKLQELKDHKFTWSPMLGCYVGRAGAAVARGVPEGFLAR